jgi:ABC-type amino acid transport system permease subunit
VGGRGLAAELSVERRYAPEPSLREFLEHRAEIADRSETTLITWVCAAVSVAVFVLALCSRLRLPDRRPMTRWLLKLVATSVVLGISGGPVLFVLMMVVVLVIAFVSSFLAMAWLMISYWFGFEVPPMSFH